MAHEEPLDPVEHLQRLFESRGSLAYGEAVTQLEHALQCGALAEAAGASDALVLASWLHDLGHLLHADAARALADGRDDRHELLGAKWLATRLGPAVAQPVALHVEAKRYLCAVDPHYASSLSPVSIATLSLQGGPHSPSEAQAFAAQPYAADAVRLRRWDEAGKLVDAATPSLEHFLALARTFLAR